VQPSGSRSGAGSVQVTVVGGGCSAGDPDLLAEVVLPSS
jgi:hypothetical protein